MPAKRRFAAATVIAFSTVLLLQIVMASHAVVGRVLRLEELTFVEIDRLDRKKSVFFLTIGNLEQHGPHLPVGADYFQAMGIRDGLIKRLRVSHPDYDLVLVPPIMLGEEGPEVHAGEFNHIGTFPLRFETLRAVAIDWGSTIARKGFKNVFLVHSYGFPLGNTAFNQAAAFVSEEYDVRMVNISSLIFGSGFYSPEIYQKHFGQDWQEQLGYEGHAGAAETSVNLFLRGDLVKPDYKDYRPFLVKNDEEFLRTVPGEDWQGYWGNPSRASKALGEDMIDEFAGRGFQIAKIALAGGDLSALSVYPASFATPRDRVNDPLHPEMERVLERLRREYQDQAIQIQRWLSESQR